MALRKGDLGSIWACLLVCLLGFISEPQAQNQTLQVATTNGLTALEANLAGSGVIRVQFAPGGYSQPGQLSLTASSADSIIFERSAPDTSLVQISNRLLRFEGLTQTAVVLRGLAFRLDSPAAELLNGRAAANQRLLIDSCILYADSVNSTIISWLGKKAEIRRSLLVIRKTGTLARIDLEADTVAFTHNLFNFEGVVIGKTLGLINLTRNTVNKAQFNLTTDGTTRYIFLNNRFAFPPSENRLPVGDANLYPMRILGVFSATGSSVLSNLRDALWNGFIYGADSALFSDASNVSTASPAGKSDTTLWDWRIASDTVHGAWSGSAAQALPPHNIFPGQKSIAPENLPLNPRPTFHFEAASLPRYVPFTRVTSLSYPPYDSLRTFFSKDTAYQIGVPPTAAFFSLQSLTLPNDFGTPRLIAAPSGTAFALGNTGAENSTTFISPSPSARILIPAFGKQNTWKGKNVAVADLGNGASVVFDTVTRAGRTQALPARRVADSILADSPWKRYRPLLRNADPVGFGFTSNAVLGVGSKVTLTLPRAGSTTPHKQDSVYAFDGNAFHKVIADSTHYRMTLTVSNQAPGLAVALFEKLALGRGTDALDLVQGHRILSVSDSGYQFAIDSASTTDAKRMPHFDGPIRLFKPSWMGREVGSELLFEMKKVADKQAAYVFVPRPTAATDTVAILNPSGLTSETITITLNMADNSKPFLIGRKYSIPGNLYSDWSDGEHFVDSLISSTPGDMRVDSIFDNALTAGLTGKLGDSLRLIKMRQLIPENLNIGEAFKMAVKKAEASPLDSVRVYVWKANEWIRETLSLENGFWRFSLQKNQRHFALLRRLPKPPPIDTPKSEPKLTDLTLAPRTHFLAELNEQEAFTWAYSPDSVTAQMQQGKVRFELCEWADTTAVSGCLANSAWEDSLPGLAKVDSSGRVTRLKAASNDSVKSLALRVVSIANPGIMDTAFVRLVSKATLDSITIKPDADPEIRVVEGQPDKVNIVPTLDSANSAKLKEIRIKQTSLSPNGDIRHNDTSILAEDALKGMILTVSDGVLTTFSVSYVSAGGKTTYDTTTLSASLPAGFAKAVNDLAPALATDRRELIGSPFQVKLGALFPGLGTTVKTPAPEIAVYEGDRWNRIDKHADNPNGPSIADVTLDSGKGYLVYLPEGSKPQLPEDVFFGRTVSSLLAPDTLKLVKGWQIIGNPKPFAIADADIELDPTLVSYFCRLEWSGSPLKESWQPGVDTLYPFVGYAVHSKEATPIVFNPRKSLAQAAKKATTKFVNLNMQTSWGESGTLMLTDAKTSRAFPKQGFASRLQTTWKRNQSLVLPGALHTGMSETFLIMGKSQGKVRLSLSASDPSDAGNELFVWSPVIGQLLALSENPELAVGPGWQELQLLKLAPGSREAEQKRLRSLYPSGFTYRIDFKRGRIAAAVPVGTGASNNLSLLIFDLDGRIGHQSLHRNLQPGWHEWTLPRLQSGRSSGGAFLRLQWRDAQGQQSKLFPLGAQP